MKSRRVRDINLKKLFVALSRIKKKLYYARSVHVFEKRELFAREL